MSDTYLMANANRCTVYPQHQMVNQGRRDWLAADLFECECGETAIGRTGESKARASMLTQVGGGSDALPALLREDSPAGDAMRARLGLVYRHSAERVLVDGELVRARRLESSWEAL